MKARPFDPASVAERARSNGWLFGQHSEEDKQRRLNNYDPKVLAKQDAVLDTFAAWNWAKRNRDGSFEECKESCLCPGAPIPELHELKDFWRFYKDQSVGILHERPTARTLRARAKEFKAGFGRRTGNFLNEEDTEEINRWLKQVLPYELGSGVKDVEKPKYNYKGADLGRNLKALWTRGDLGFINERYRIQFHFLLLLFCSSGARRGGLLKEGVRYKDIQLVLDRTEDRRPKFFFKLDQRTVKNNKDTENKKFGVTGREHVLLQYNAVFFLLSLAFADNALDSDKFLQILEGDGQGPIDWNEDVKHLPICKHIDRRGVVDLTKPMSDYVFHAILRKLLMVEYGQEARPSMHMIRRELGKQLDERYTDTERSQHVLQADRRVFGQSYVASTSSCDGFAAFLQEQPDHTAVEYFQGISQFWQPGLPTQLPAAKKRELLDLPEMAEYDRALHKAVDRDAKVKARQDKQNALKRLERKALETHRAEELKRLRKQRLERGVMSFDADADLLSELIPQKGRIAATMSSDEGEHSLLNSINDMVFLLKNAWGVYYRPDEEPSEGRCPFCDEDVEKLPERQRSRHIHSCRRKDVAGKMAVPSSSLRFCFFCMAFYRHDDWGPCDSHLSKSWRQYGSMMYRNTRVRPAFCLVCKQAEHFSTSRRLQYWERDADAIRHIEQVHGWRWKCLDCDFTSSDRETGCGHLHDAHGYKIPKLNSVKAEESEMTSPSNTVDDTDLPWAKDSTPDSFDISDFISFPPTPEPTLGLFHGSAEEIQPNETAMPSELCKDELSNGGVGHTVFRAKVNPPSMMTCYESSGEHILSSMSPEDESDKDKPLEDPTGCSTVVTTWTDDVPNAAGLRDVEDSDRLSSMTPPILESELPPEQGRMTTEPNTKPRIKITIRIPRKGSTGHRSQGQGSMTTPSKRIRLKLNSTAGHKHGIDQSPANGEVLRHRKRCKFEGNDDDFSGI